MVPEHLEALRLVLLHGGSKTKLGNLPEFMFYGRGRGDMGHGRVWAGGGWGGSAKVERGGRRWRNNPQFVSDVQGFDTLLRKWRMVSRSQHTYAICFRCARIRYPPPEVADGLEEATSAICSRCARIRYPSSEVADGLEEPTSAICFRCARIRYPPSEVADGLEEPTAASCFRCARIRYPPSEVADGLEKPTSAICFRCARIRYDAWAKHENKKT